MVLEGVYFPNEYPMQNGNLSLAVLNKCFIKLFEKCSFLFSFEQVMLCSFKLAFGCLPIPERMGGEVAICSQSKQCF